MKDLLFLLIFIAAVLAIALKSVTPPSIYGGLVLAFFVVMAIVTLKGTRDQQQQRREWRRDQESHLSKGSIRRRLILRIIKWALFLAALALLGVAIRLPISPTANLWIFCCSLLSFVGGVIVYIIDNLGLYRRSNT
jgi:hypothetical protein